MLATGDPVADREAMILHARAYGWRNILIERYQSTGSGNAKLENGEDKFRMHRRLSAEWMTVEEN